MQFSFFSHFSSFSYHTAQSGLSVRTFISSFIVSRNNFLNCSSIGQNPKSQLLELNRQEEKPAGSCSWFSPKMCRSSSSWVWSGSDHVLATDGPLQSPLESFSSSRSCYACLVRFWCAPECDCHIHTCPKERHQGGQQTLVQFNPTNEAGVKAA